MNRIQLLRKMKNFEFHSFDELEIVLLRLVDEKLAIETMRELYRIGAENARNKTDLGRIGYIERYAFGMLETMISIAIEHPDIYEKITCGDHEPNPYMVCSATIAHEICQAGIEKEMEK